MDSYSMMFPSSSSTASSSSFTLSMANNSHADLITGLIQSNKPSHEFLGTDHRLDGTSTCSQVTKNNESEIKSLGWSDQTDIKLGKKKGEKKIRKPRYAFQTRSQVDILDDGYRWRKYGQKAVKNNKFPRSYYRCTHQGCNVKKQVQRLSKDESVVVTTYEGMHSHPIEKSTDNFEHILRQMQIYSSYPSC
ncbi:WRKY domain [Dillenia turbinata]|uniref:WRKY domain n=1 Tax=Dillenia turbinata TaxID=194707 RepID=A0AAN8VAV7_9MAGN